MWCIAGSSEKDLKQALVYNEIYSQTGYCMTTRMKMDPSFNCPFSILYVLGHYQPLNESI